jgi:hypothetical protein
MYNKKQATPDKSQKTTYLLEYLHNKGSAAMKIKKPFPEVKTAKKAKNKDQKKEEVSTLPLKTIMTKSIIKGSVLC